MAEATNNPISETTAPPPPPEVKVRTMRSDIASMAASGGGLPRFESVAVEGLAGKGVAGSGAGPDKKNALMITLVVIVGIAALAVVAYFAYTLFLVH